VIRTSRLVTRRRLVAAAGIAVVGALVPIAVASGDQSQSSGGMGDGGSSGQPVRAALPPGKINDILVIDMENSGFSTTWGPSSPATYLNGTLRKQGELIDNYYATTHNSLGNYIAQVSGQSPTNMTKGDCPSSSGSVYVNVSPATDDPFPSTNPGQVDGDGCIYPAPTATSHGAPTIADQLDAVHPPNPTTQVAAWRQYAGDMGNSPSREGGTTDLTGGTDCAHPTVGGADNAEGVTATDQYANRHKPFIYFHSIIDNQALCNANEVPLGTLQSNGTPSPTSHLVSDLSSVATTPTFGFVTPNTCDDGHDNPCIGLNEAGTHTGGMVAVDAWMQHWMPTILNSLAYRSGSMLVVITSDESEPSAGDSSPNSSCCYEQPGPNTAAPGDSSSTAITNSAPGGGKVGALLLNTKYIKSGTENTTGSYNHYSASVATRTCSDSRVVGRTDSVTWDPRQHPDWRRSVGMSSTGTSGSSGTRRHDGGPGLANSLQLPVD
jgi:phosphatidylinositol-3-phosphatase